MTLLNVSQSIFQTIQRASAAKIATWFTITGFGLILCACDQNNTGPKTASASQVAAKVDGDEISIHQVNDMLERTKMKADDEATAKLMRKQILDRLVDQQLLVQKAVSEKLDRTPDVQMALDAARREVLATAYLKQFSGRKVKPDDAMIKKYYDEHPPLFSRRRVFILQEINFNNSKVPAEAHSVIKAIVEAGKPIDETIKALRARGIEFSQSEAQRASEQITIELLPALYTRQPGQGLFVPTSPATSLLYVKSFDEVPLPEADAWPRISRFLENQNVTQQLTSVVSGLRAKAKIDYFGDFFNPDNSPHK